MNLDEMKKLYENVSDKWVAYFKPKRKNEYSWDHKLKPQPMAIANIEDASRVYKEAIKKQKQNFNGGYIKASQKAYDLLVEAGYKAKKPYNENSDCYWIAKDEITPCGYYYITEIIGCEQFYINNGTLSWDEPKKEITHNIHHNICSDNHLFNSDKICEICGYRNEPTQLSSLIGDYCKVSPNARFKSRVNKISQKTLDNISLDEEPEKKETFRESTAHAICEQYDVENLMNETISITDEDGKAYEFEKTEFECELLKVVNNEIIGYFVGTNGESYFCTWTEKGRIWKTSIPEKDRRLFDLIPIKPKELTLKEILQDVQDKQMSVYASELLIKARFKIKEES